MVRHRLVQKPKTSVQFDSNVSTHQIPVQAGTPAVPIIPAVPANTVPLTAPVVYAAPTMGLGEEQIRQLIRGVTASADPHAAFQQLLQCYGSAMSEQDKQFLLRELEKGGGHPGSSQMNPLTPGVPVVPGLLPPELSAFMSQMPQFLNTSVAAGSPEFAALQQQFMGLMQMMMTTMMSVSANPITQPAVVAPTATFPTPNVSENQF